MNSISKINTKVENIPKDIIANILRENYKKSLYLTAHNLLGMKDVSKTSHKEILDVLESGEQRRIIIAPRGSLKSSIGVVAYSIWCLLRNPNERILIDSAVYTNSKNFIREIKAHLESDKLIRIFGKFRTDTNWTEGSITISQRTHPYKESSITAGGLGATKVSQHYSTIIMDDISADKNSATIELRQKVIDHYKMNIALLEPDGVLTVIGTRYAADDIFGHIFSNEIQMEDPGTL